MMYKVFTTFIFFVYSSLLLAANPDPTYTRLPDGSLYNGDLKYNVIRDGTGHNKWPNGREYKGEWFNDQPHGKGTMTLSEKSFYRGEFVYGRGKIN